MHSRLTCPVILAFGLAGAQACADNVAATDALTSTGTTLDTGTATQGTTQATPTGTATGGTGPVEGFSPEPRWVLRDKDGARVQALVEPRCGSETPDRCRPLEFDSPNSFPCARVIDHEGRYLNLLFDLESGKLEPCMPPVSEFEMTLPWNKITGAGFADAQCAGTAYSNLWLELGSPEFTTAHKIWVADGDLWLVSGENCLVFNFWWANQQGECESTGGLSRRCPFVVVPDWVKNLLPNPPYTMSVEYG